MTDPTWYSKPGADAQFIDSDELTAALAAYAKTTAIPTWDTLASKPAVIAAGATAADARTAIGAGTSDLALGTTSTTALPGNTAIPSTASDVGAVPTTRTVNGKALSADVTLAAADVSALPSTLGSTATSNVVVVANGATAPAGLPDGTVIVEKTA